ncbi:hypothetical protein FGB62_22g020 [Gracilaria domingensis]|nr:hypothetical protein FGB62_22g020 [Gracilaria domingensis]
MEYVNNMEVVDDLLAILNPEVAMKVKGAAARAEAQAANDEVSGDLRFSGNEERKGVPSEARRTLPGFARPFGRKILSFIKEVPARVGGQLAACFGKLNGKGKWEEWQVEEDTDDGAAEEAGSWSPDFDSAVMAFEEEEDSEPHFDYAALEREDEQAWKEFNEWWDEFLKPLPVIWVDESELMAVLEQEEMERRMRGWGTGSFRSIVDLDGGDCEVEWVVTEEEDFWGTLPSATKGRVRLEVERIEAAMKAEALRKREAASRARLRR